MKRFLCLVLTAFLLLSSVGALAENWTCPACGCDCTSNFCPDCGTPRPETETPAEIDQIMASIAPLHDGGDYAVMKEYTWESYSINYCGIVLKNMTDKTVEYTVEFSFRDADDQELEKGWGEAYACDPGSEVLVSAPSFSPFDHVVYGVGCLKTERYHDVRSFVTVTAEKHGDKVFMIGQNHGNVDAQFVQYHLFFKDKDGNCVGYDYGYLSDLEGFLRPGQTVVQSSKSSALFNSVEVYFDGRTEADVVCTAEVDPAALLNTDGEGFEVTYIYTQKTDWDNQIAYVIKNTSEEAAGYEISLIFRDAEGQIVDIKKDEIRALAPGYEGVVSFFPDAYDHVDYCIYPVTPDAFTGRPTDAIQSCVGVSVERSDEDEKMTVSVVNNSDGVIHVNGYYYILFDGAGQPVVISYGLLTGEDGVRHEMQPGETFTDENLVFMPYESASIYVDGYMEKPVEKKELDFGSFDEILESMMNELMNE